MNDSMAATETSVGGRVIVFAQSIFLQSVALCVNSVWGLDCKFRLEAVELHHVSTVYTREVCIYMMFVFKRWRVLAHLSSNQQPSLYGNNPVCPHTHTHTLATSLLITIEIVIDLSYLSPVAIRSHLLSGPYWKGKRSWCYRLNECPAPGCSADAVRLALSSMMDGANSGYTFTTTSQLLNSRWM